MSRIILMVNTFYTILRLFKPDQDVGVRGRNFQSRLRCSQSGAQERNATCRNQIITLLLRETRSDTWAVSLPVTRSSPAASYWTCIRGNPLWISTGQSVTHLNI